jgi:hypothetical protein
VAVTPLANATWPATDSQGLSGTSPFTAWLNGPWQELEDVTTAAAYLTGIGAKSVEIADFEIDIGLGAAASEVVLTTFRARGIGGQIEEDLPLAVPTLIPSGSRVSARFRKSISGATGFTVHAKYSLYDAPVVTPTATFTLTNAKRGADTILARVTITIDGVRYPWAGVALADPIGYEDGLKDARLLLIEDLVLALSDRSGNVQASRTTIEFSDLPDREGNTLFRRWLGQEKKLRNADIEIKLITDHQRRLQYVWKTVFRGKVQQCSGLSQFRGRFECVSTLSLALDQRLVTDTIGRHFTGCPTAVRTFPLPIALGRLTDAGSSAPPPVAATETARGVYDIRNYPPGSGYGFAGYGDLPGTTATNVIASEIVGGGNLPAGTYRFQVFAYHSGISANPMPFLQEQLVITVGANAAIDVTWTAAAGGADFYRVALAVHGPVFFGVQSTYWHQYIQTTGLIATFTKDYAWDWQSPTTADITPGASLLYNAGTYWEAWTAVLLDGETGVSSAFLSDELPFANRPHRACAEPVTGALYYYVYRGGIGAYTKRLLVPNTQVNADGNIYQDYTEQSPWELIGPYTAKGKIKPIFVGPVTDLLGASWPICAVYAAHACDVATLPKAFIVENEGQTTEIVTPIASSRYGTDVAIPGQPGWTTLFGAGHYYTDALGTRWAFVAYRGGDYQEIIDGTKALRVNILGAEATGAGTSPVLTSVVDQLALLVDNLTPFAATSLLGGNWASTPPTFADSTPKRDTASFTKATTDAAIIMPEGLIGARWITESMTWATLFAEIFRSGKLLGGCNADGQLQIVCQNPFQATSGYFTDVDEILKDSFEFHDQEQGFANIIPYEFDPVYTAGSNPSMGKTGEVEDLTSQTQHLEERTDATLSMPFVTSAVRAKAVAELTLQESKVLPRMVPLGSGIHWVMHQLGATLSVTHKEGPEDGGYVQETLLILGLRIGVKSLEVQAMCIQPRIVGTDGAGNSLVMPGNVTLSEGLRASESVSAAYAVTASELLRISDSVQADMPVTAQETLKISDSVLTQMQLAVLIAAERVRISESASGTTAAAPRLDVLKLSDSGITASLV